MKKALISILIGLRFVLGISAMVLGVLLWITQHGGGGWHDVQVWPGPVIADLLGNGIFATLLGAVVSTFSLLLPFLLGGFGWRFAVNDWSRPACRQ